jgi:hypothetical protein
MPAADTNIAFADIRPRPIAAATRPLMALMALTVHRLTHE